MNGHGGSRAGAGRKPNSGSRAFRELVEATLSPDDWRDIVRALAELAKSGKTGAAQAAHLLLTHYFGPPTERHAGDENLPPIRIVRIYGGTQSNDAAQAESQDAS